MRTLLLLSVLPACSVFDGRATLESSVILAAHGRTEVTVQAAPPSPLSVELHGLGPGGVTFDARAPDGTVMAHGVLTTDSRATCETNEGELIITFTADAHGAAVGYVLRTANGGAVTTKPL